MVHLLSALVILMALVGVVVVLDRVLPRPMSSLALAVQHALGGLKTESTAISGFDVAYLDGGSGEPLVLVHGIGADKDNFAPVAPFLRGVGRIIALDLPGFGDSGKLSAADYSIEAQGERPFAEIQQALRVHRCQLRGRAKVWGLVAAACNLRRRFALGVAPA